MISSVVVNYRCARLTCLAVESLLTDMPQAPVVVVDNSVDAGEAAALRTGLPRQARLVVSPRNIGFGAACNMGVQEFDSDYVMFLNPDARVFPGCLEQLKAALDTDATLGAVSPLQYWDTAKEWMLPPAWLPTGPGMAAIEQAWRSGRWASQLSLAYRQFAIAAWTGKDGPVMQRALSGGAMMVRRSALAPGENFFDPAFFMYYEDSDLSLRLRRRGNKLALVPGAKAVHEWTNSPEKASLMHASREIYLAKHYNQPGFWQARKERAIKQKHLLENPLDAELVPRDQSTLDVPLAWQESWLMELSPSPLMLPAIGHLGKGAHARLPEHWQKLFESGTAFARIGPIQRIDATHLPTFMMR